MGHLAYRHTVSSCNRTRIRAGSRCLRHAGGRVSPGSDWQTVGWLHCHPLGWAARAWCQTSDEQGQRRNDDVKPPTAGHRAGETVSCRHWRAWVALGGCVWLNPRGTRSPAFSLFLLLTWALRMLVVQSHISSSSVQDRQLWVNRMIQETEGVLAASMEKRRRQ